jgi:hypothetical protein
MLLFQPYDHLATGVSATPDTRKKHTNALMALPVLLLVVYAAVPTHLSMSLFMFAIETTCDKKLTRQTISHYNESPGTKLLLTPALWHTARDGGVCRCVHMCLRLCV